MRGEARRGAARHAALCTSSQCPHCARLTCAPVSCTPVVLAKRLMCARTGCAAVHLVRTVQLHAAVGTTLRRKARAVHASDTKNSKQSMQANTAKRSITTHNTYILPESDLVDFLSLETPSILRRSRRSSLIANFASSLRCSFCCLSTPIHRRCEEITCRLVYIYDAIIE